MHISVLGSVTVWRDGQEVPLGPQVRRLFARLVVDCNRVVSTDRLADSVWDGEPPPGAHRSLKTYVSRLRNAIDPERPELIAFSDPGYVLSLNGHQLDSGEFETELDEAISAIRVIDHERAVVLLTCALARWHGDAYVEFAHEEWARPEAVRLEERRVEATELLIEAYLGVGDTERAVAQAQSLARSEPLRERPRELLMRSLYIAGRQPEALREYRSFRKMLSDDVGLDPSRTLVDLERRIAIRDASLGRLSQPVRGYELCERVGHGAFAVVHRAIQPGVRRDVAIKIIRAPVADQPSFVRDFEHEAHAIASVEHPHVVPLYDYWREPGAAFLVMRLMRGGSVEDSLRTHGAFSPTATVDLLGDIGPALEAAHRLGIIHRDVRPANLLLDQDGGAYLSDFGIAVWNPAGAEALATAVEYAAPEVLRGEPLAASADVHSLGVTIFELLTGRLPFAGSSDRSELLRRQLAETLPSVRSFRHDLPDELDDVLRRATAKAPEHRHATVGSLVDDVVDILDRDRIPHRPSPRLVVENPYVGLHAFDESDAHRFHGRQTLVADIVQRLTDEPLVVVVGPSGSGKSSVVRAGLVPALRQGAIPDSEDWFVTTMVPGTDPVDAFEAALLRVAVNPPASLRSQLEQPGGLLRAVKRILPDDDTTLLLVLDQFEELFTLTEAPEERDRFLQELARAVRVPSSPLRIVATLRADHYDEPLAHPAFATLVTDGTVTVRPLKPSELEEVIDLPARSVGVEVEPALTAELVASATERPASLPLLQFALTETFRRRASNLMSVSTFHELGGLTGAIAATADHIVDSAGTIETAEARRIVGRLVTLDDGGGHSRRRAAMSELGEGEVTTSIVERLVEARLLTVGRDDSTREPTVEVAHEALLRDWPRLRNWLKEDRANLTVLRDVRSRSTVWLRSGRDDAELARGARLVAAQGFAETQPELLNARELEWVQASIREQERESEERRAAMDRERRQNRRLRALLGAAAVLLVVSVAAASIALVLRKDAVGKERDAVAAEERANANANTAEAAEQTAEQNLAAAEEAERAAQQSAADAEIERLVALSAAQIYVAPDRAMLLALEANRRRDDAATRGAVQRSIATEPRLSKVLPVGDDARVVTLSDDATTALVARENDVSWIDIGTGEPTGAMFSTDDPIREAFVSGDGTSAAVFTAAGDREVTTILRVDGEDVSVVAEHDGFPQSFAGGTVTLALPDTFRFVDAVSGSVLAEIPRDDFYDALSADGRWAALAYDPFFAGGFTERRTEILEVATGEVVAVWEEPNFVNSIEVSNDGTVVTGYVDGSITLRDVSEGDDGVDSATTLTGHSREVTSIAIAPDGRFVSAGGDRSLHFWTADGALAGDPARVSGRIADTAFGSDGRVVATQGNGGPLVFDTDRRPIVDDRFPDAESAAALTPTSPWASRISSEGRGVTYTNVDDLAEQHVHDLSEIHPGGVLDVWAFSPDGEWVLTIDAESTAETMGTISVSAIDGSQRTTLDGAELVDRLGQPDRDGGLTLLGPDGDRIFVEAGTDESAMAGWFETATGEVLVDPVPLAPANALVLRDGGLVRQPFDGPIEIRSADLELVRTVEGTEDWRVYHQDPTTDRVVASGGPGELALIDPATGEIDFLTGLASEIADAAFSPTGEVVAAVSPSEGIQLYDVASARPIGVPMASSGQAVGARFGMRWASDGTGVWFTPSGGPARLVTDPDRWREIACASAGRELTAVEWENFVSATEPRVPACS